MTIPEISPLFLLSMCGLSFVCVGLFVGGLWALVSIVAGGELFSNIKELLGFGGDEPAQSPAIQTARAQAESRDLRSRAQSFDFDSALQGNSQMTSRPQNTQFEAYGENTSLRPDGRQRFNANKRDLDLAPPGRMSDNPHAMSAPPPPDFNPNNKALPNTKSNIGGRVGRHNTGRGQSGQRMDSARFSSASSSPPSRSLRSDRNARRDDEFFGGHADFDGDGDVDI
ncbi:MAG: hypothetical protein AAF125_20925 [Chloroflexota bacterium]